MKENNLKDFTRLFNAAAEGKTIEQKTLSGDPGWIENVPESLALQFGYGKFNASNWRVKPDAPKVEPHTFETAPDSVKVKQKGGPYRGRLVSHENCVTYEDSSRARVQYTYEEAAALFELLDGSPYGIEQKEESEWPKWVATDAIPGSSGTLYCVLSEQGPTTFLVNTRGWGMLVLDCGITEVMSRGGAVEITDQGARLLLKDSYDAHAAEVERIIANAKEATR